MSLVQINDIFLCNIMNRDLLLLVGVIAELDRLHLTWASNANVQLGNEVSLTSSNTPQ